MPHGGSTTRPAAGRLSGHCTRASLWIKPASSSPVPYKWHPTRIAVTLRALPLVERYLIQNDLWINEPLRGARSRRRGSRRPKASGKACCSHPDGSAIHELPFRPSCTPPDGGPPP